MDYQRTTISIKQIDWKSKIISDVFNSAKWFKKSRKQDFSVREVIMITYGVYNFVWGNIGFNVRNFRLRNCYCSVLSRGSKHIKIILKTKYSVNRRLILFSVYCLIQIKLILIKCNKIFVQFSLPTQCIMGLPSIQRNISRWRLVVKQN